MEAVFEKWDEILTKLKDEFEIKDMPFKTWLLPLKPVRVEGHDLYLSYPSGHDDDFIIHYIPKHYSLQLQVTIQEVTGVEYDIQIVVLDPDEEESKGKKNTEIDIKNYADSNLNKKYTFDTFVVGSNNRFAQNAALAVAEAIIKGDSENTYNPLYIYGGPGLGKTHLMHAIGNYILSENPEKKVLYVTSEDFTNEVINSIRANNNNTMMSKFRSKYRSVDVLLIDDIQFIIGKESTQEEFFHTFNALHSAGKQIVISSDRHPKEMETLEERIRSRFEWGLTADIGYPDYELRMAILRKKVEEDKININDEILNYIATNIKSNVREIEGALNKLIAYSKLENTEITLEVAIKELSNIISPDKPKEITPQIIIEVVAEHFNITIEQMTSNNRSNFIARPRQIAMYLCKTMTDSSLEAIGQLLGGRNHSTIIHGASKIADEYETDSELKADIDAIKKKISVK